jgi:hypothetical protein
MLWMTRNTGLYCQDFYWSHETCGKISCICLSFVYCFSLCCFPALNIILLDPTLILFKRLETKWPCRVQNKDWNLKSKLVWAGVKRKTIGVETIIISPFFNYLLIRFLTFNVHNHIRSCNNCDWAKFKPLLMKFI